LKQQQFKNLKENLLLKLHIDFLDRDIDRVLGPL